MELKPESYCLQKQSQQATVDNGAVQLNCMKTGTEFNKFANKTKKEGGTQLRNKILTQIIPIELVLLPLQDSFSPPFINLSTNMCYVPSIGWAQGWYQRVSGEQSRHRPHRSYGLARKTTQQATIKL